MERRRLPRRRSYACHPLGMIEPSPPLEPGSSDDPDATTASSSPIESISAVTLATTDMERSLAFYLPLGFPVRHGGPESDFTSLLAGNGYLNIQLAPGWVAPTSVWGRVIIWVDDVDEMYERVLWTGAQPEAPPADAAWGERYFHVRDPDGHELSFARLLPET